MICIFPNGENIHLIKDVGMVPFMLYKEGYYDSTIAFYEDEKNLPYLRTEVQGLRYKKISKIFDNEALNIFYFLLKNISQYDVVMFFHGGVGKVLIANFFKIVSISKIKFYIKLDYDSTGLQNKYEKNLKFLVAKKLIQNISLITVETKQVNEFLNTKSFYATKYLPNGFNYQSIDYSVIHKENLIITVARIGTEQKDNETFLRALEYTDLKNWKVKFIGPIEESFKPVISKFYEKNPHLKNSVEFAGPIHDRDYLAVEYAKAKVFVLTSLRESFGLVLVEALARGCYIVSTDLVASHDITDEQRYGTLFPIQDSKKLSGILQNIIDGKKQLPNIEEVKAFAEEKFSWTSIVKDLYYYLEK